jgi:hypothetical protein
MTVFEEMAIPLSLGEIVVGKTLRHFAITALYSGVLGCNL